jgi:hypothetical protein
MSVSGIRESPKHSPKRITRMGCCLKYCTKLTSQGMSLQITSSRVIYLPEELFTTEPEMMITNRSQLKKAYGAQEKVNHDIFV